MNTPTCGNGHPAAPGQRFCAECGVPIGEPAYEVALPPNSPTANKRIWLFGLGGVVVLFAGLAWAGLHRVPETSNPIPDGVNYLYYVGGELVVYDSTFGGPSRLDCELGYGGYLDIHEGTPVVAKNESGEIVGAGSLSNAQGLSGPNGGPPFKGCHYDFFFDLKRAEFYTFEVASDRGGITIPFSEMERNLWQVQLTLG